MEFLNSNIHPMDRLKLLSKTEIAWKKVGFSNATPLSEEAVLFCKGRAIIQPFVTFDGPIFLEDNVLIGPYTLLRGPLFIGKGTKIGPYCEITRSIIMENTTIAHKNIIPDSIVGSNVWLSGGVILCNIRLDKKPINVIWNGVERSAEKFGGIIGNNVKLGVNVITMPGTYIRSESVVVGPTTIKGII